MGIPGLTRFLDNNDSVLKNVKLSDINVIIDGSNLVHFIYYYYNVNQIFGGDYKIYAEACKHFFQTLQKCCIVPYIVLDGAYHPKGKKFSSSLNRISNRAILADEIAKGGHGKVLPVMALDVFVEVSKELGISCVCCNFEADYHIASLAALWKCPILTNDSDFFIFDLPGGVILLDYLNIALNANEDGTNYLNAQIFYSSNLAKFTRITNLSMLPLFATLMGNDVVDGNIFQPFCKKHDNFSKVPGVKLKNNVQKKIPGILRWLAMKRNFSSAVEDIVTSFGLDRQQSIRELIEMSVATYTIGETFLSDYFGRERILNKELESIVGPIPQWFQEFIQTGVLAPRISNAFVSQRCLLLPQVETFKHPSSHLCGLPIRMKIYGILLKSRESDVKEIREFEREGKIIRKKTMEIVTKMKDGSDLPSLIDVPTLSQDDKMSVISDLFQDAHKWYFEHPHEEQLFLVSLRHWVSSASPDKCQVLSLLTCFYAPEILQKLVDKDPDVELLYPLPESTISKHLLKTKNRIKYFDISQVYSFNQFQSIFQSFSDLNKLLLYPLADVSATKVFSATSLVYVCHHLESNLPDIFNFLELNLNGNASILETIKLIWTRLGYSADEQAKVVKNKSKKKMKKEIVVDSEKSEVEENIERIRSTDVINVDVENKFALLLIND